MIARVGLWKQGWMSQPKRKSYRGAFRCSPGRQRLCRRAGIASGTCRLGWQTAECIQREIHATAYISCSCASCSCGVATRRDKSERLSHCPTRQSRLRPRRKVSLPAGRSFIGKIGLGLLLPRRLQHGEGLRRHSMRRPFPIRIGPMAARP